MKKLYLNLGCGSTYHDEWYNIDFQSRSQHIIRHNLLKKLPFPDNKFEVVYHNNVLEHFPKYEANFFISECHRVLKKGGIIRIVVPDLEGIVKEYFRNLENALNGDKIAEANYDWIMLELFDQITRTFSGGEMMRLLQQDTLINEQYIIERCGTVVSNIRYEYLHRKTKNLKDYLRIILTKAIKLFGQAYSNGRFRMKGEVHQWMYDRFSLKRLIEANGFNEVEIKDPHSSNIENWADYELDIRNGILHAPNALYMEARKY